MIYDKYKSNLVLDWDLQKGSLADQSTSGFDATVVGTPYFCNSEKGRAMEFDGVGDSIKTGDVAVMTAQTTVASWVKFSESPNGYFFVGRVGDPFFSGYFSGTGLQIQCLAGGSHDFKATYNFGDNTWHHVVAVRNGDDRANLKIYIDGVSQSGIGAGNIGLGTACNALFGNGSSVYTKGKTTGIKVWNTVLSAEDVAKLYEEESTRQPYTAVDFKSYPSSTGMVDGVVQAYIADGKGWNESTADVTSGFLENTGFEVQSGTWKVNDVDSFNKQIECISSGIASMPMNQAYGTWEFKLTKGADANTTIVSFMNDQPDSRQNGYYLIFGSAEQVNLSRRTGGAGTTLMETAASTITVGQEYDVKITRATNGEFTVYLDGVAVTAGTGTNPVTDTNHTTCSWTTLDIDTDDIIRDFRFIPYIE